MTDNLAEYRRRRWPRECFPPRVTEAEIYNFTLWKYIGVKRAAWAAERRALRPALRLRLAVRLRWCWLAPRTVCRLLRLMLVMDGTLPARARRQLRGR